MLPAARLDALLRTLLTVDGHGMRSKAAALRYLLEHASNIGDAELDAAVERTITGSCPLCSGAGHSVHGCPRLGAKR